MKNLIAVLCLGFGVNAYSSEGLLFCKAKATDKDKTVFEIQTTVYDIRVESQGSSIHDYSGKKKLEVELKLISKDDFVDNFSIQLKAKKGNKVIEAASLLDQSLKSGPEIYFIRKDLGDYKMELVCSKDLNELN
jgi:hypothetical protein